MPVPAHLIASANDTIRNAGRSDQNARPSVGSRPGSVGAGTPTQAAPDTLETSYAPSAAVTAQPATMPITGYQSRHRPVARSPVATATASVVAAAAGATKPGAPSGPSAMLATATGRSATAISTITVPVTAGVTTRRRCGSHAARAN